MMIAAVELLAKKPQIRPVAQIKDAFTNKPPSPHLLPLRHLLPPSSKPYSGAAKAMKA